jgi:hypothetical protein
MDSSKQSKINSLVEDQETYRFLLDDLLEQNPSDTAGIAELQATIKKHEDEIAELLGTIPGGSSETSSTSTPNGVVPRSPAPVYPPTQSPSTSSPTDLSSAPYHPSAAPSPFLTRPAQSVQSVRSSMSARPNEPRKRQRQDSTGSTVQVQSSKRTAVNRYKSRYEELQADMESQLKSSRELHEEAKDPQTVQTRAMVEGISTDEVLEKMEKEQKEEEDAIRSEFQMEMDEEMARMVQAEDAVSDSDDDRSSSPLPVIRIPDRTLPIPQARPYGMPSLIDPQPPRRYPVPTQFDYNPAPPGSYPFWDDDLQEIPREYFNSRIPGLAGLNPFGYRPPGSNPSGINSPALGPPRYTPMFGGPNPLIRGRSLPWMHDPNPALEMAAIDLLSNNPLGLEDADDLE